MTKFTELERLEKILPAVESFARVEVLRTVKVGQHEFPIHGIVIGSEDRALPTLGLFGGVHGLERVGTDVVVAFFDSFFEQIKWDQDLRAKMQFCRIVCIPIVNPGGMFLGSRSNPSGVDLMRNAPVEATVEPLPILGGHRISPKLPYYRGPAGAPMEPEAQTLVDFVRREMFSAEVALALDLHSGFGAQDRLWYPYAKTTEPYPRLKETLALGDLFTRSYPNHVYKIEPQSLSYTTHGDLWDYLFDLHWAQHGPTGSVFIPLTLEMGSWIWIRKNPWQLFSAPGTFNPIKKHRLQRTMRRHVPLIDFLLRALKHHKSWL